MLTMIINRSLEMRLPLQSLKSAHYQISPWRPRGEWRYSSTYS